MRRTRGGIRSPHKLIADVTDRAQTLGMAGVVLDLLANPAHMDVDGALVADERVIPELLEQLLAAKDLAGMPHQKWSSAKARGLSVSRRSPRRAVYMSG